MGKNQHICFEYTPHIHTNIFAQDAVYTDKSRLYVVFCKNVAARTGAINGQVTTILTTEKVAHKEH